MNADRTSRPEQTAAGERSPANTAGAYGFSCREGTALVVFALLVLALSGGQWLSRRFAAESPVWAVDDVLIDTLSTAGFPAGEQSSDDNYTTINVNTASRYELMRLPGIGETLAQRIIEERERDGPFASLVDFQRVRGIGPKTATALIGWVRFSSSTDTTTYSDIK